MVELNVLLKVLSIFFLALISPGPDFMIVSSMSLTRGLADGIKTAAGISIIIGLYTLISLTGLSALFLRYVWVVIAIKICGGLYLLYLSYILWSSSLSLQKTASSNTVGTNKNNAFILGALTTLTNPKSIAFFASIFALSLTPDTLLSTKIALAIMVPSICFAWFCFVAFGLSKDKIRLRYQCWKKTIDQVTGTVLGFFGLKLLFSARN